VDTEAVAADVGVGAPLEDVVAEQPARMPNAAVMAPTLPASTVRRGTLWRSCTIAAPVQLLHLLTLQAIRRHRPGNWIAYCSILA